MPWPLLVSLGGGLIERPRSLFGSDGDLVNRAMNWTFFRDVDVGETVRLVRTARRSRRSSSRPEWTVVTLDLQLVSASGADVVAAIEWTLLHETEAPVSDDGKSS